jgi:hypothetical protein
MDKYKVHRDVGHVRYAEEKPGGCVCTEALECRRGANREKRANGKRARHRHSARTDQLPMRSKPAFRSPAN